MRIAHLILAHKNQAQLSRLVHQLLTTDTEIFIHLDAKSNFRDFISTPILQKCNFINQRVDIKWAGTGTIQATLHGFSEITQKNSYDYINVISGQDFPIKPIRKFIEHLTENAGTQFITSEDIYATWTDAIPRVEKYYLTDFQVPAKYTIERLMNAILPKRKFPAEGTITGRSNWFTITAEAAKYILSYSNNHPELLRFFKFSWGADEIFFSTILYNSKYREKIKDSLTYVDWSTATKGHPKILTSQDLSSLISSQMFFARKFDDSVDNDILLSLEKYLNGF